MPKDYTILEPISPVRARFQARGRFEDRDVLWDVTLEALHTLAPPSHGTQTDTILQQVIDIDTHATGIIPVHILLALPVIHTADIEKTVIMLRQYKRLARGRYTYGPQYQVKDKQGCIIYTEMTED